MATYDYDNWDKGDARANNEHRNRMGFGGEEFGGQRYAQRSRTLGQEKANRGAYLADMDQQNEARATGMQARGLELQSRGQQGDAVNLARSAAMGRQPSAAETLARRNTEAAVRAGQSMAGGVKGGPGARVAAMRNAQRMGAQMQAEGAQRAEQLRAQEMETARGQYLAGTNAMRQGDSGIRQGDAAMRGQDLNAQQIISANENAQRDRNDAQERFYEQQGYNIQAQDQNNQLQQQGMANGAWAAGRQAEMADEQFGFTKQQVYAGQGAKAAEGAIGAATATSDERAKNIIPAGSLAPLFGGGRGAADAGVTAGADASFDKLTPGGGMDVTGSLKAHSNFATKFQRDPSGGMMSDMTTKNPAGVMTSDMQAKSPGNIMYSPGEIKNPASLDDAMRQSFKGADPYRVEPDRGVAGAPRGYAASRSGQSGDMFAAEAAKTGEAKAKDGKSMAPGSSDWERYGKGGSSQLARTMANPGSKEAQESGATQKGSARSPLFGSLMGLLGGLSGSGRDYSRGGDFDKRDTTTSDDKAKVLEAERKAYLVGRAHGVEFAGGGEPTDSYGGAKLRPGEEVVDYDRWEGKSTEQMLADAGDDKARKLDEEMRQGARALGRKTGRDQPWTFKRDTPVEQAKIAQQVQAPDGPLAMRSDEKAKEVIDLDEGAIDLDRPEFDQRNPRPWFQRDTPDDQRRVKRGFEDELGRDADRVVAGMKGELAKGSALKPKSKVSDKEAARLMAQADAMTGGMRGELAKGSALKRSRTSDKEASKLAAQADAMKGGMEASLAKGASSKRKADGSIPKERMFAAMKAMEPSLYSYKPEFKPPEQSVGEVQAGPMANNMERDPVAGTAIVKDPKTGLLAIDKDKALKLTMGSLAVLAKDVEKMKRRKGKKGARS